MVKLVELLSLGITRSSGVIEAEREFVAEMVDSFYKSLVQSLEIDSEDWGIISQR